ncbi:hypothetical protein INS49_003051 [Diaporthe citri]|uniref:uncharacterized protein n=1 Tax=Diaporthe citri TaxID=83186 RepID=UPI001C809CF7|nr:uncharacterized protein INS49_003051 [Diaporthe citri]KAG6368835.1 hypothetical protein INS49_003051 [Diaporthe citri]
MVDTLSLEGKVAIITGSGRETGIGAATATALARNGASVTINYVSDATTPRAAKVVKSIQEAGGKAIAVQADVTKPAEAKRLVGETLKGFNTDKIDILKEIDATFATSVRGPILLMQATVPHMPRFGRIINVSSVASRPITLEGVALYGGGKAAMDQITFAVAAELGKNGKNITVNTVAPGITTTDILSPEAMDAFDKAMTPMAKVEDRPGHPNDIADTILLLVQEKSRWITGQYISCSGGITGN